MKISLTRLAILSLAGFTLARAAINLADDSAPFTAKEISQGFREHVILARPKAQRRATVDGEESREGLKVRERFARFGDLRVIELDDTDSAASAVARLAATGRYEFVELDRIYRADATPNDPSLSTQWSLANSGQSGGLAGADIKALPAWDIIHDAPNVVVAVLDTGINVNHQDLAANIWRNPSPVFGDVNGARFANTGTRSAIADGNVNDDDAASGHGTHVAGTIGAVGNNGLNVAGVAWKVQLMAVKVLNASGSGSTSDIAKGINYAVEHGAHIINASLGEATASGFDQSLYTAIAGARLAGVLFVAAAGNDTANTDLAPHYPGSFALDNILTVGCSQRNDFVSSFSNYGAGVDLFAPGESILSLSNANTTGTRTLSGTSMAAPHVAGALALLKAQFPTDTYRQLINRLLRGTDAGARFAGKSQTGGRLNLLNALTTTTNRPFNDDFALRPRFTSSDVLVRSSNVGATSEPLEPEHAGATGGTSLWWEWTPAATGSVSIDTSGSGYDTLLSVYTGSSLGTLTPVASNDDDNTLITSRVRFVAQAGVTYQIAVAGKNNATGLTLLNLGSTPSNDAFATPVVLTGSSALVTAANAHCSAEPGEPRILGFAGGTSLWYRWTAPKSGTCQIGVVSDDFDPLLAVYTGTTVSGLTLITASDNTGAGSAQTGSLCTFSAIAGVTYVIKVDAKSISTIGQFSLSLNDSLWQAVTGSSVTGSPAVAADGTIYAGSTDFSLYAFAPDGSTKWTYATGGTIDSASPAIGADGTVYVGSNDGKFYAVNPDGTGKWAFTVPAAVYASNSPAVAADGTIYFKAGDGYVYALNPTDGSQKWRANVNSADPSHYGSPTVGPDGTIYQGGSDTDRNLYALNPADGTLKWKFATDTGVYTPPAVDAAGNLYFSSLAGVVYSLTSAGAQRWKFATGSNCTSAPALSADGSTLYYGAYDAKLRALDASNGAVRWAFPLGDEVRASSPAIDARGVIYVGCYDQKIYAVNPDGTLNHTWATGKFIRSCPAIAGTTLYCGSNDGRLYAFDLGTSAASGPWPQYRANARRLGRTAADSVLKIVSAPQAQTAVVGYPVQLTVAATGPAPLTYQWYKDGAAVAGATSATLTIASATAANAGDYSVVVTSPSSTVPSAAVHLTVEPANPGRLINLSARAVAGRGGEEAFVIGFALAGSPAKSVLVRGLGPALLQYGVTDVLADPRLVLYSGSTVLTTNNDWASSPTGATALAAAFAAVSTFPLDPGSKDAAVVQPLFGGNLAYSALIDSTGPAGVALAELYDTAPASGARLINVSARGPVGTGGNILIAGFAISGNVPKQILIRGVGPSLSQFGFTGMLSDPKLELFSGATVIQSNDNWGGAANLITAFGQTGAFNFTDNNSRDAAMVVTLPPGNYTAQVSGVNNRTGVALVEIYEIP